MFGDRAFPAFFESLEWTLVTKVNRKGEEVAPGLFKPIPRFVTLVNGSWLLAIAIRNPKAPDHWRFGGIASALLDFSPSTASGFDPQTEISSQKLSLGRFTLMVVPKFPVLAYFLEVRFAQWHEEVDLAIYKYQGSDDTLFELLPPILPDVSSD